MAVNGADMGPHPPRKGHSALGERGRETPFGTFAPLRKRDYMV